MKNIVSVIFTEDQAEALDSFLGVMIHSMGDNEIKPAIGKHSVETLRDAASSVFRAVLTNRKVKTEPTSPGSSQG